ncbi:hypothetical protein WOE_02126 [Enterococcus faecalis EnGen0358]|nr:hypothetical protein WOE_02126 [Enterococcus faecalis EnGen0358]
MAFYLLHNYMDFINEKEKIIMDMFGIFIDNWWN